MSIIEVNGATIEIRAEEALVPLVMRALNGSTHLDAEVDALPVPAQPWQVRASVRFLRWYRASVSPRLGQRCGMDPSCSRYAELAVRRHGVRRAMTLTILRLRRCRPGSFGTELP